jgi:hypothetical protein
MAAAIDLRLHVLDEGCSRYVRPSGRRRDAVRVEPAQVKTISGSIAISDRTLFAT